MVVQGSTTAASSVCFIRFIAVSVYAFSPANKLHKSTPLHCNGQTDRQTGRRRGHNKQYGADGPDRRDYVTRRRQRLWSASYAFGPANKLQQSAQRYKRYKYQLSQMDPRNALSHAHRWRRGVVVSGVRQ